jgi:hypothetical protein
MFNSNQCYSLADIAAATGGNRNSGGFGDDNGAWWIIILFLFAGWGGNGNGFGGRGGTTTREEISYGFDINGLENGVRSIQNGLCDGFYALNTSLLNGFNGIINTTNQGFTGLNTVITNGFSAAELARCNSQAQLMAQLNQIAFNQQDCCCQTQRAIDGINYNMATQACDTRRTIADAARDIIENANANYRALHEENIAIQMAQKDDRIADLTARLNRADLAASQAAQNAYLIGQIKPCPEPAYIVPNPNCCTVPYSLNTCAC